MNNISEAQAVDTQGKVRYSDTSWVHVADWLKANFDISEITNFNVMELRNKHVRVWVPKVDRSELIIWETEGWK